MDIVIFWAGFCSGMALSVFIFAIVLINYFKEERGVFNRK